MRADREEIRLKPAETLLQGYWLDLGSSLAADARWERITLLTNEYLEFLATDDRVNGRLYRDPADQRLWELTPVAPELPQGPPLLQVVTPERAAERYGVTV